MRTPTGKVKPRRAQSMLFPAPTAGWIANRSKAIGNGELPPGATILENWFPTSTGIRLRRGSKRWATLGEGNEPVTALFVYSIGGQEQFFGATASGIWDISVVPNPFNMIITPGDGDFISVGEEEVLGIESTAGLEVLIDQNGGNWITVQTTNTDGGTYLRGVNGVDTPFVYDGAAFSTTPALTFAPLVDLPGEDDDIADQTEPEDLNYVWSYKRRLFFIKKDSLDAYYLPVSAIGGDLTLLPLGAVFNLGGYLMFGASWSLGTSDQGGLSAQCVFITSEGEVAVYQGSNPDDPDDWGLVGVYRIGKPLGNKAHISAGGDIVIATTIGFLPLSEAVQREYAALAPAAVSNPIEDAWRAATERRSGPNWSAVTWPDGQMVVISPPAPAVGTPQVFAANANTGAWCNFTGWDAKCLAVFQGSLFFGSENGAVVQAYIGGSDDGIAYTARYLGLYETAGNAAARKVARLARATVLSAVAINPQVAMSFDYRNALPSPPSAPTPPTSGVWDSGIWDQSRWDESALDIISAQWVSVGGSGARMAPSVQLTSGSAIPIDAELVGVDVTYDVADIVS